MASDTVTIHIKAHRLLVGDVWLGDGTELTVIACTRAPENELFVPWGAARTSPPVPMQSVIIHGTLWRKGLPEYKGQWTLQPDMPVEVRRSVTDG